LIRAKKSLGQNFLVDERVSRRIVEAVSPQSYDLIIEIGPGTGALTGLLAEASGYVIAIEIDRRLIDELERSLARKNLSIIEADALSVSWPDLIDGALPAWREHAGAGASTPRVRVVANLPYYISTPIIESLIRQRERIFDMTLMLQSEVVERMTSAPGGREYGYMSVLVQYHCQAEKLFEVPPSAFKPAPKVRSAIIRLTPRANLLIDVADEERFFALVSACFAQRRKTISNNLKAAASALKLTGPLDEALKRAGIDARRRAETLSIAEFGALYRALFDE
jgi:16S rRNA (adenine1518-N6/adenine1519-N6)-dimethyltransferase